MNEKDYPAGSIVEFHYEHDGTDFICKSTGEGWLVLEQKENSELGRWRLRNNFSTSLNYVHAYSTFERGYEIINHGIKQ